MQHKKTRLSHTCVSKQPTKVLSGDSWASGVARSLFEEGRTEPDVAFFFVSYILIASVMLMNVVVAVLLGRKQSLLHALLYLALLMRCTVDVAPPCLTLKTR
jgi:hypothetical protein